MQQGWRHPTTLMYDDCIAVLEAAVACGGIDPDRLFVGGVSAGAMMTAGLVSYCDHFRAAFAQMGLYDLRSYVGTVDEGAVAWDQLGGANYWATMDLGAHSPLAEAHYIKTPILLIAGQADMRTPASQTEELYRAIKLAGTTPSRLVLFPELGHGVGTSALTYLELMAHPMAWFDEHDSHK
jgi:dipeptidyl aminopeptidase/acylaminoacyl peptidase